jgi:hypothetical protein
MDEFGLEPTEIREVGDRVLVRGLSDGSRSGALTSAAKTLSPAGRSLQEAGRLCLARRAASQASFGRRSLGTIIGSAASSRTT